MAGASAEDLEEIAEGKASARDKQEAGETSEQAAKRKLALMRKGGRKTATKNKTSKASRKVKRKRPKHH